MTVRWPVLLAWLVIALDGFDLVVLGTILPTISAEWRLNGNEASAISTAGLVGVAIGAVAIGTASDRLGRRPVLIACVAWFSVLTLLCALSPSLPVLLVLRFLAGVGLGGCFPVSLAMSAEYARRDSGSGSVLRSVTAYHVGAVLTALIAIPVVEDFGWRPMFVVGGALGLVVLPFLIVRLPESVSYLAVRGRTSDADALARRYGVTIRVDEAKADEPRASARSLVNPRYRRASLALFSTSFLGLLLVYGLNTWLPAIMAKAGYELGASLALLLTLNVGAITGLLVSAALAERVAIRSLMIGWFATAALFLAVLSIQLPLVGVYAVVFAAGVFTFSSQVLVYAYVSRLYPAEIRATALGYASGVGRVGAIAGPIVVGVLVTADVVYPGGFYFFALVAVVAAVTTTIIPAAGLRRGAGRTTATTPA